MKITVSNRFLKKLERGEFPNYFKLLNGEVAQLIEFEGGLYWDEEDNLRQELAAGWYYLVNGSGRHVGPYKDRLTAQIAAMQKDSRLPVPQ